MFKFTETVLASDIWPDAENHVDKGYRAGFVRGYNFEVKRAADNLVDWMSACFIEEDPEQYVTSGYYPEMLNDWGFELTGRICFRGYAIEEYDFEERETYVVLVPDDQVD